MRSLKRHPSSGPGAGGSRSERFVLFTVVLVSIFLVGVFWELERKNSSFRYDWGLLKAGKQQECNCAKEVQRDATLEYPKSAVFPPGGSSSPLPAWKPSVPAAVLRRGVAYAGDLLRMDQLLSKVVEQRKALTVVSIGSSCTSEFGGRRGPQLKLLNLDPFEVSRVVHPDGWLSAALDHLVELFPPRQPKRWDVGADGAPEEQPYWLINLGIGAVGPEPWLECLGHTYFEQLPPDVDLVVVEFALASSDGGIFLESLDRLLQRLMRQWDPPPALLLVNFFFWCRDNRWCREYEIDPESGEERLKEGPQQALNWSSIGVFAFHSFDRRGTGSVVEDNVTALAQYYGVPSLSMRDAFWHLAAQTLPNYGLHDVIAEDDMGLHPGLRLARERYADVLIGYLRSLIPGLRQRREEAAADAAAPDVERALLELPPPFFKRWKPEEYGRKRVQTKECFSYETVLAVPLPIRSTRGFEISKDPDSKYPKPGLITWQAGSEVEFKVDTRARGKALTFESPAEAAEAQAMFELSYLVSYERMGTAEVACVKGCTCEGGVLDATITEHWSVPHRTRFDVTQSAHCIIRVTSGEGKGGSKFKIMALNILFRP